MFLVDLDKFRFVDGEETLKCQFKNWKRSNKSNQKQIQSYTGQEGDDNSDENSGPELRIKQWNSSTEREECIQCND